MVGRTSKVAFRIALLGSFLATVGLANYSIKQTNAEYDTLKSAISLPISSTNKIDDVALLMAMASKESSFYDAAVGQDNEVGLVQLKPDAAIEARLKVQPEAPQRPNVLERIIFSEASQREKSKDERFDKSKNLQASYAYLQRLSILLQKKYNMNRDTSIDFALIAYNLGIGNVGKLLESSYPRNPDEFIRNLLLGDGQNISARKRIVVANHFKRVKDLQIIYQGRLPTMIQQDGPSVRDYVNNSFKNAKKAVGRLY